MNWNAFTLSLRLAASVMAILLALGLPLAYGLVRLRWRWKFLLEAVVALPLVLPPTVLGFYILVMTGPRTAIGRFYESWGGSTLPFTFAGLLVASVLYSLPFAVQPFAAGFAAVDSRLIEAAAVCGAGRWKTFTRVVLPLSLSSVVTGAVLSFAHTMGEFGVVLMVGGNIPGVTRTVSIDIYDSVQALDMPSANQTALVLLLFSFVILSATYAWNRRAAAALLEGGIRP
jgi:molybdate transport system permease protein